MKNPLRLLCFFCFIFLFQCLFSQDEQPLIDEGCGPLKIGKKVSEIKTFLTKTTKDKVKHKRLAERVGEGYSSIYFFNPAGLKIKDYFGARVTSVEVYCEEYEGKEDVAAFVLYLEQPKTKEVQEKIRLNLIKRYKEANTLFSPDFSELVYYSWFSDKTLLTFIFGIDYQTGNKTGYYQAVFESASG